MAKGKTTLMNRRVPKKPNKKGLVSEGNIGTGGNMSTSKVWKCKKEKMDDSY